MDIVIVWVGQQNIGREIINRYLLEKTQDILRNFLALN